MTRSVCLLPAPNANGAGGVMIHVNKLAQALEQRGWEIVAQPDGEALVHCHAMDRAPQVDIYTNHGVYPLKAKMAQWQIDANKAIFDNLRQARQVVAVSQWTAEQWGRLVGRYPAGDPRAKETTGDTWVIYNGVDLAEWENVPTGHLRAALRITAETPLVLWGKTGLSDVLDPTPAIELALRRPDIAVVALLQKGAIPHAPKNMHLIGPQPFRHMQAALADCDVYLATVQENHAIQVLEAMALQKPILGYRHGGTAETVTDACGALVKPGDMGRLVEKLDTVLSSAARMGQEGRERVERMFTLDHAVERLLAVYERALEERERERAPGRPKVSVVIPCYNKAAYVGEAIKSVLRQRQAPAYELVVVDDGSKDASLQAIAGALGMQNVKSKGLNAAFKPLQVVDGVPVRVIAQENAGVATARNNGIAASQGQYICCLDADDRIDPLFLSRLSAALDADPGLGIAYSDMMAFGMRPDSGYWQGTVLASEYEFERLTHGNFIPCCNLFRRTAFQRAGGYKDINPSWEDYELWLNMGKLGWHGRRIPGALFWYRKLWQEGRDHESQPHIQRLRAIVNSHHRDIYPPLASVVIPCYKHSRFLKTAINSALAQSWPDLEVVVVDDGNEPAEATAIGEIVDSYPAGLVRLVTNDRNLGLAAARNAGIDQARGTWIVPLDADDKLAPAFLEKTLSAIQQNPRHYAYSDSVLWWPADDKEQELAAEDYVFANLLNRITHACTILYARDAWLQVGGYKPVMSRMGGWEDWEFVIALGEIGICGVRVPEPLFWYRQHSANQMRHTANDNKPALQETIRRLHPAIYRGEFSMACCGSKRGAAAIPAAPRVQETRSAINAAAMPTNGADALVLVRYVGGSVGSQTFKAPSGMMYRFGLADPLKKVMRDDADWFATMTSTFQVVPA